MVGSAVETMVWSSEARSSSTATEPMTTRTEDAPCTAGCAAEEEVDEDMGTVANAESGMRQ